MNSEGNILVITSWSFKDALVQTYTLPYVDIIRDIVPHHRKIFLVTEEKQPIALSGSELDEVNREWKTRNMQLIAFPYRRFGWRKLLTKFTHLIKLLRIVKKLEISIIHAFCTPAGSLGYMISKITGRQLIVDSYEPHAESMVENGTWKKKGLAFRILFALERRQSRYATFLIGTTAGMKDYAKEKYGVKENKYFIKPACVNLDHFNFIKTDQELLEKFNLADKITGVYAGKLGGIYYDKEVFDFIRACYEHWGNNFRFLMLTNASEKHINEEIRKSGIPDGILISQFVFHREVPRYLALADFAINPVKPVPTKKYCTSIKDGEYWATGLPVIISPGISDDSIIIENEKIGVVMDFSTKDDFTYAIKKMEELLREKVNLGKRIRNIAEKYRSFEIARDVYANIYTNGDTLNYKHPDLRI